MRKNPRNNQTIALFVPTLNGGGAERVMIMIANGLAEGGLKVDLITGNAKGPYRDSISPSVNLIDFGVPRLLYSLPLFARYLLEIKPRSVLSALNHANVANVFLSRLLTPQTRVIISIHNSIELRSSVKLIPRLTRWLIGWAISRSDLVVSVSEGIRGQLLDRYGLDSSQVTTIYNPLDVEAISDLAKKPSGNKWLDNSDLPVIIGVGSLTEQKNFELLIRSFEKVQRGSPSRLVILGEGENRNSLESIVDELGLGKNVLMPGFVSNPFSWVSKSSIFVLSSNWEGLPGVLLEALACGVQVVSTDCKTGPREILEDGKWGPLVKVGDREALTNAIIESLEREVPINTKIRALDFSKEHAVVAYRKILAPEERQ